MKKRTNAFVAAFIITAMLPWVFLQEFALAYTYDITTIRVGLNSPLRDSHPQVSAARLENPSGFTVGHYNGDREFVEAGRLSVADITVSSGGGEIVVTDSVSGNPLYSHVSNIAVAPAAASPEGTLYTLNPGTGTSYYGGFEFVRAADTSLLTVINYVNIEDYVKGVLPYEMPASWPAEALKAQAICARTYAVYHLNRYSKYGFDVCNTAYSQVYEGVYTKDGTSNKKRADDAVDGTAGEVILYNGSLIDAVFHAASGGATEDASNVWGGSVPYLKGVSDEYEKRPESYAFNGTYTANEIYSAVKARNPGFELADIADISCVYTEKGNILSVIFTDSNGKTAKYDKEDCRTRVLRSFTETTSQRFSITKVTPDGGTYAISSAGYGHNVGMSQYGAKGMAEAGFKYDKIISHYYTDISLFRAGREPEKSGFTDVEEGAWYYDAVMYAVENELFNGTGQSLFSPNAPMNRAMFVTVLGRALNIDAALYGASAFFTDVPAGKYYTEYVSWAYSFDLARGYNDGSFRPEATITREEMCALLNRFSRLCGITLESDASVPSFLDSSSVGGWAFSDVDAMRQAKIVSGRDDGRFYPKNPCTRAEVAQVLMNFLSRYPI